MPNIDQFERITRGRPFTEKISRIASRIELFTDSEGLLSDIPGGKLNQVAWEDEAEVFIKKYGGNLDRTTLYGFTDTALNIRRWLGRSGDSANGFYLFAQPIFQQSHSTRPFIGFKYLDFLSFHRAMTARQTVFLFAPMNISLAGLLQPTDYDFYLGPYNVRANPQPFSSLFVDDTVDKRFQEAVDVGGTSHLPITLYPAATLLDPAIQQVGLAFGNDLTYTGKAFFTSTDAYLDLAAYVRTRIMFAVFNSPSQNLFEYPFPDSNPYDQRDTAYVSNNPVPTEFPSSPLSLLFPLDIRNIEKVFYGKFVFQDRRDIRSSGDLFKILNTGKIVFDIRYTSELDVGDKLLIRDGVWITESIEEVGRLKFLRVTALRA